MASRANGGQGGRIPWRLIGWAIPVGLLTIPAIANWPWSAADFVVAGAMFAVAGGTFELAVRSSGNIWYRTGAAIALATAFLVVWINLAVGIIGSEDNPLNLMFFGVIAAALAGSIATRFRAGGMARSMTIAAILQGVIGVAVFLFNLGHGEPPGALPLLLLIELFALAWLLSAWCFRKAVTI